MTKETRIEIDKHLSAMATISANLGKDSLVADRIEAKVQNKKHLEEIKKLDLEFYKSCISHPKSNDVL